MLRAGARAVASALSRAPAVRHAFPAATFPQVVGVRFSSNVGDIYARTGLDPAIFEGRKVVIYKPPQSPTQNGKHNGNEWKLQFDMKQKWANPLMGWTSGKDTLGSQVFGHLSFENPEQAKVWCEKLNIDYRVEDVRESKVNKKIAKRYEDNFRWEGDELDGNTGFGHWAAGRQGCK
jgi:hypothetical protein